MRQQRFGRCVHALQCQSLLNEQGLVCHHTHCLSTLPIKMTNRLAGKWAATLAGSLSLAAKAGRPNAAGRELWGNCAPCTRSRLACHAGAAPQVQMI